MFDSISECILCVLATFKLCASFARSRMSRDDCVNVSRVPLCPRAHLPQPIFSVTARASASQAMPSSNIQKLLKKLAKPARKVGGKRLGVPWRKKRHRTYVKLTKQERKDLNAKREEKRDHLMTLVYAARNQAMEAAKQIAAEFGHVHKPEYYYKLIMQKTRLQPEDRKISEWNAFVSKEMKEYNAGTLQFTIAWVCALNTHYNSVPETDEMCY